MKQKEIIIELVDSFPIVHKFLIFGKLFGYEKFMYLLSSEFNIDIWNDNIQPYNRKKNSTIQQEEASLPAFSTVWTSISVLQTSYLGVLDVGFIPPLPTELPYMANNNEYNDEYNDEYLCHDFIEN